MDARSRRLGAVSGLAAGVCFIVLYAVAMSLDSEYVFGKNYLSDLGVREGAWAFNSGLIIAGVLFLAFDILSIRMIIGKRLLDRAAVAMLVIGTAFLILVGIFTEDAGDLHGFVSYGFFLSMLAALGLTTECMYRSRSLGRLGYAVTLVVFLLGISLLPMGGDPLSETIAVLGILSWGLIISVALLLKMSGFNIP
ncbi:MAG: hypothetical protein A3K60_01210 [Euryarchaeota archaeon RBG_19FT_COMBO_56_21]|nr:MAG: hypothetical protein A3K60_01210 [Euryarchaeota archaeon RBG_19FT_COMBO_56_21]